ncbi:hypothetical protein CsSME_00050487 [Camellia sinensis var. sinensis]
MSQDQKFQQRWEFRRRDDDLDSSSHDSKSSSGGERVLKNHTVVSNLTLPENDETGDAPLPKQESQLDPDMGIIPFEFTNAEKIHSGPSNRNRGVKNKMKKASMKKSNRKKKNNRSAREPILLDDFKIFMKSIIEELKVARENMFTRMRDEMKKLVDVELASRPTKKGGGNHRQKTGQIQHQNNVELGMKTQNCNGGSLERSVKSDRTTDSNNCHEVFEEKVNHDKTIGTIASNEKEKVEMLRLSVRKPISTCNLSDQVVSSVCLTLPTVLSEPPRAENHKLDSSCNYTQPEATGNKTSMNLEKAKLMVDAGTSRGYYLGIQQAEQFRSFSQAGSQNMCYRYSDQNNTETSTMGSGFPVPLHQGLGAGFNIPSQPLENLSHDNHILGPRMNGGAIRFSGGSHALPEHFGSGNFHRQMR